MDARPVICRRANAVGQAAQLNEAFERAVRCTSTTGEAIVEHQESFELKVMGTRQISEALASEQELARLKDRMRSISAVHPSREVSNEERLGAALLRILINHMDVFLVDNDYTLFRVVLPNQLVVDLDTWECATEELEADHDFERAQLLEMSS